MSTRDFARLAFVLSLMACGFAILAIARAGGAA